MPKQSEFTPFGEMVDGYRRRRGLKQKELSELLGISTVQIWKQLTGRTMVTDQDRDAYRTALRIPQVEIERFGDPAPTRIPTQMKVAEPTPSALPRQLQIFAAEFEIEAMRLHADEREMAYIRMTLRIPEAIALFRTGHGDRELPEAEQMREMAQHVDMLRRWLLARIKRRRTPTPSDKQSVSAGTELPKVTPATDHRLTPEELAERKARVAGRSKKKRHRGA